MIYEFIATMTAGFGLAGLALIITHLSKLAGKRTPKWLIPLFAAIGIFSFQIHQEYSWYDQQAAQLPKGVKVIKTVEDSTWFRPWSYIKPQTVRFMAVDSRRSASKTTPQLHLVNLYLFERRMSIQQIPQVIDCRTPARADYLAAVTPDSNADARNNQATRWYQLTTDDPLYLNVCTTSTSDAA
ncbi:hypothetical protein [Psychrobacter aestuarii]|uniref:Uncharacterized protein n=1 Tax=Psychrobacter aestuarii TaxID=556327 RepID=A0ABN0VS78_9GAMM|nr:hypothetical protein [Psychrobacter aestuarii]